MEILRGKGHQQNALLQLADDLRFTAQKSLACGARLSKGRSENDEAILERTSGILLEQKPGQSFDNFMRRAASVGRAQKYLFMPARLALMFAAGSRRANWDDNDEKDCLAMRNAMRAIVVHAVHGITALMRRVLSQLRKLSAS